MVSGSSAVTTSTEGCRFFGSQLAYLREGMFPPRSVLSRTRNPNWSLLQLPKSQTTAGWATVAELAKFLGQSTQNVRASYVLRLPADDVRPGRPVLVRVQAVLEMIISRRVAEQSRPVVSDDPLLADGDSPGLERYRMAKAKHAELDLEQRRGELIDVSKCRDVLAKWASVLRRSGDRIARTSPDGSRMLGEALDECESIVRGLE